jgi:hypothetical protein
MKTDNTREDSLKVSSGTIIFKLNTRINIDKLFENIILDNHIIGVKYNNTYKGVINKTNTFYNQTTINCWFDQSVSVKMFVNGNCHMSGSLTEEKASYIMGYLIDSFLKINGIEYINVSILNDIIFNTEGIKNYDELQNTKNSPKSFPNICLKIYGTNEHGEYCFIGTKRKDFYVINGEKMKLYNLENKYMFLSKNNHQDHLITYKAYSTYGGFLGYVKDTTVQKCKTDIICKYNQILKDDTVFFYDKRGNLKRERRFDFDIKQFLHKDTLQVNCIELKYKCFDTENFDVKITNMNINYLFNTGIKRINKFNLNSLFVNTFNIESDFSVSTKLSNVVVKFTYDDDLKLQPINGIYTYTCKVVFYTTGKIIIHSSSPMFVVQKTACDIKKIISDNLEFLTFKNVKNIKEIENINIFDIL